MGAVRGSLATTWRSASIAINALAIFVAMRVIGFDRRRHDGPPRPADRAGQGGIIGERGRTPRRRYSSIISRQVMLKMCSAVSSCE